MSKVYYIDLNCRPGVNLLQKLRKLIEQVELSEEVFKNKFVAIKIHFGEPGNLAYLRPNFSKVVGDYVKEKGGKPFLTDCNTLYVGRRKDGLEHMDSAYENGYSPFQTGMHVVIGDGIKGTDEELVELNLKHVKEAKIGKAIMDADVIISMNHFKGHESTGFGGALKNLGMGCGSRRGKMEMHNSGKPHVIANKCVGCQVCSKYCAHNAITFENKKASINHELCVGCTRCMGVCNFDAIATSWDESNVVLNEKIAEYSLAVVKGKPNFHINFLLDISPNCDCHSENDVPIAPNVGILASLDPVAIDQASADLVSEAASCHGHAHDVFTSRHPNTNWHSAIEHGEAIGLGTKEYELIKIKM